MEYTIFKKKQSFLSIENMLASRLFWVSLILINTWNLFVATEQYACEELIWKIGDNELNITITKDGLQSRDFLFGAPTQSQLNYIGLNGNISIYNDTEIIVSHFDWFCLDQYDCKDRIMKYNQYLYFTDNTAMTDENPTLYFSNTSSVTCTQFKMSNNSEKK